MLPIAPDPEVSVTDVVPVVVPDDCPTAPLPLALAVTTVPLILPSKSMLPLLAVAVKERTPFDVSAVVVAILLLLETDKLAKVSPSEVRLRANPALVTVTAPVVLIIKLGVEMFIGPMAPDVEVSVIDGDPDNVPAV
jgi:hypothetical protein